MKSGYPFNASPNPPPRGLRQCCDLSHVGVHNFRIVLVRVVLDSYDASLTDKGLEGESLSWLVQTASFAQASQVYILSLACIEFTIVSQVEED